MDLVSVSDLAKDGGKKLILWVVQILIINKLPVTPDTEKIKDMLQETVKKIKEQLQSIQESRFKGAVYAFSDGCIALQEALEIRNQPKNQLTDQGSSASATGFSSKTVETVQNILKRANKQFRNAEKITGELVNDSKNLTDQHRLTAWKIYLQCVAINSGTPAIAARSWQHRLEDLAESSKTDLLAQYMLGQVEEKWYRFDKSLRRACEEWRNEVAATALLCLNTAGEPKSALRKVVDQKVQESCKASDNLMTDWFGIIRSTLLDEEEKCAVLKPGLWIQAHRDAIKVYRRNADSSEITEVKKITIDLRFCWGLSKNRISDKLFDVIVSTYVGMLVRFRVEQNEEGEITVAETGSRNAAESQEVSGYYLPSERILVEIRDKDFKLIGHWIYDDWDAIPDPIFPSENRVNTTLDWCWGAISYDSMLYFFGQKSDCGSVWLVPETETERHSEFKIPDSEDWWGINFTNLHYNLYQPSEQLVTVQYESSDVELVTVVLDMPSRTVICRTKVEKYL